MHIQITYTWRDKKGLERRLYKVNSFDEAIAFLKGFTGTFAGRILEVHIYRK